MGQSERLSLVACVRTPNVIKVDKVHPSKTNHES